MTERGRQEPQTGKTKRFQTQLNGNKPRVPSQIAETAVGQQVHVVLLVLAITNSLQPSFFLARSEPHCCLKQKTWDMKLGGNESIRFQATTVLSRQQSPTHCANVLSLWEKARHQPRCLPQPSLSVVGLVLSIG